MEVASLRASSPLVDEEMTVLAESVGPCFLFKDEDASEVSMGKVLIDWLDAYCITNVNHNLLL